MSILKIFLWIFVIIVVVYAIVMAYNDVVKYIPQEKKKVEKFDEPKLKIALFYAEWCGHCSKYIKAGTFMDTYDKLKQQKKFDKVVFVQFDFDKNKELGNKYGVSSFPTIVAISSSGDLVGEFAGDRNDPEALIKFTSDSLNKI
jgi:protein disulfide-isomerase A6